MRSSYVHVLRSQGRGITGALLVAGLSVLYTMETWSLGWELPLGHLIAYAFVGLGVVLVLTRRVGFREEEEERPARSRWRIGTDFAELLVQSFVAAYVILLVFGLVDLDDSPITVVRLGLIEVVPVGFGAAVANQLLVAREEADADSRFPRNLVTFALGAVFVTFPVAPTDEIELMAVHAGWGRLALVVALSIVTVHLVLHVLEFRGHGARTSNRSERAQLGMAFVAYAVGVAVSVALLAGFGHFSGTTPTEWVQQVIVLSFLASIGASAGEVVL